MKKSLLLGMMLIAVLSITNIGKAKGQDKNNKTFDELICKEWKLQFYEEQGKKIMPTPDHKEDRMIFYKDKKVKSIEIGDIQHGVWKYDATQSVLTVVDNDTKEKVVLKVIKIMDNECVLEFKDPDGSILKMHMLPV